MVINMDKLKYGYSLVEACVVMIIVAIFVAVMANSISHKPKAKVASEAHGRFECYYEGDTLYQQMFTEGSSTGRVKAVDAGGTATSCAFVPPYYAKYMIIDAVGGGAGGSSNGGASEGQFVSTFYASIQSKYMATPGKGGALESDGGKSVVTSEDGVELIAANGGKSTASLENTTVNDILSCNITEYAQSEDFDCHIYPTCEVKNGKIVVNYCRSKAAYIQKDLTYKFTKSDGTVEMGNPRYIVNNVYTAQKPGNPNVWVYHDISLFSDYDSDSLDPTRWDGYSWTPDVKDLWTPSLYTMELTMNTTANGDNESESNLSRFVKSMQYKSKIVDVKPGAGGAKNAKGYAGAILFLW